jgi:hypothetical protein
METSAHPSLLLMGQRDTLEILTAPSDPLHARTRLYAWSLKAVRSEGLNRMGEEPRNEVRVRPLRPPVDLSWFIEAHAPKEVTSSATLISIINGLHLLIKNSDFQTIDKILRTARVDGLAPEAIIAFARTCFPIRTRLREWYRYLQRARTELRRKGLNADSLLSGLT